MSFIYKVKADYIDLVKGKRQGALAALFSFFLLLLSFLYGFLVRLILFCYQNRLLKSYLAGCRVISIGNISWGGTGKTPLVETLAKFLKLEGRNPAILIRGYGKDEVYMLKDKFRDIPVLAGKNRVKTARAAQNLHGADTLVLDDGFQHWRLKRDLDIVLVDSSLPFGNRRLIPRGILREPLSSLSRADIFVLTKTNLTEKNTESIKEELRKYNLLAPIYEAAYRPTFLRSLTSGEKVNLAAIENLRVAVVSGIADPESFAKTVDSSGAKVCLRFDFPDHYPYKRVDLERIENQCLQNQIQSIITTEKDAPKLTALLKSQELKIAVLALCIEFKIAKDERQFFDSLKSNKNTNRSNSVLILSDGKSGHLNQCKAVARLIQKKKIKEGRNDDKIESKIVEVKFKNFFLHALLTFCSIFSSPNCRSCLLCFRFCLKKETFARLMDSTADIIVSAGSSLASVNLFLSYRNKARNVILMKPTFLNLDRFDLAIVPEHDRAGIKRLRDNVLLTRITPNLIDGQYLEKQAAALKNRIKDSELRIKIKGPTIGVLIGGDTRRFRLTAELMGKIIAQLKGVSSTLNSQLLVTSSRRTPKAAEELLKQNLADFAGCKLLVIANEKNIPEAVGGILGLSDIVLVSGESISMVSEAVSAQKYVFAFIPERKARVKSKQERFLENLAKEGILKIVQPDSLLSEIENTWEKRPPIKKIEDKELISQALSRIL